MVAIGVLAAEDVRISTTQAQIPVRAAEIVIDFDVIGKYVGIFTGRAVAAKAYVTCTDAHCRRRTVIDLCYAAKADTVIPGIIIFQAGIAAVLEANAGVAAEFNIADAVFQIRHADAEVVQLVGIFIGQLVDKGPLFHRRLIHMSHRFSYHFRRFIAGNAALALEVLAVDALNDAGVS